MSNQSPTIKVLAQIAFIALLALFILQPTHIFAQQHGSGKYGAGKYGGGFWDVLPGGSTPKCTVKEPGPSAPWLYAATPKSSSTIELYFTNAQEPYDHYALEYGTEPEKYKFGATDIGGKGTRTFLVRSLPSNTTYNFRVRGGNGCATGPWSNEISAKTKPSFYLRTLDITSSEFVRQQDDTSSQESEPYTLKIKVVDKDGNPVRGAKVTIFSEKQEAYTDENGYVTFENLEMGEHKVVLNNNNYEGEQSINLQGDAKTLELTVQIRPKSGFTDPKVIVTILILSGMVLFLAKNTKHHKKLIHKINKTTIEKLVEQVKGKTKL